LNTAPEGSCISKIKYYAGKALSRWLPTATTRVRVRAEYVGFVVDKVALGQVFFEYFGILCQSSFQQFLNHHNHPRLVQ
jgi:hypothetical protein